MLLSHVRDNKDNLEISATTMPKTTQNIILALFCVLFGSLSINATELPKSQSPIRNVDKNTELINLIGTIQFIDNPSIDANEQENTLKTRLNKIISLLETESLNAEAIKWQEESIHRENLRQKNQNTQRIGTPLKTEFSSHEELTLTQQLTIIQNITNKGSVETTKNVITALANLFTNDEQKGNNVHSDSKNETEIQIITTIQNIANQSKNSAVRQHAINKLLKISKKKEISRYVFPEVAISILILEAIESINKKLKLILAAITTIQDITDQSKNSAVIQYAIKELLKISNKPQISHDVPPKVAMSLSTLEGP